VSRSLGFLPEKESSLHVFVDASEVAYGAEAYVRHVDLCNEITVKLVSSKSRVAPLTTVTIPRLELAAAVRLSLAVTKTLQMPTNNVVHWTDSTHVLYWISNDSRHFKPFIANRIGEIHENTEPTFVPTNENPAD